MNKECEICVSWIDTDYRNGIVLKSKNNRVIDILSSFNCDFCPKCGVEIEEIE